MNKEPEIQAGKIGSLRPDPIEKVSGVSDTLKKRICSLLAKSPAKLVLPGLLTLGLSSACTPKDARVPVLTVAPQMTTEVQQPGPQEFHELLMQPGSPYRSITVASSIRPKDITLVLGGYIIPTLSEQSIMVNVMSDKAPSKGFYVFSETKGPLSYQINMDKALMDWIYTTPYDFILHVEQSIDQQGIKKDIYNPQYKALISVEIIKNGDFQAKSTTNAIALTSDRIKAVAVQRVR